MAFKSIGNQQLMTKFVEYNKIYLFHGSDSKGTLVEVGGQEHLQAFPAHGQKGRVWRYKHRSIDIFGGI